MEDLLQLDAVAGADTEAAADEVLALVGETSAELELGHADLLVLLKGDVTAHHVVKQNAQTPNCGCFALISRMANPFGRSVNSSSWKRN